MAYLVLARKYRPQSFADLTGQEHVVKTLTNALTGGRVAHALLFCGPRGCGKTTSARIVARALNCEQGPTPTPCGVCRPCVEIAAGIDVDVQEIDAASNTGVDNVRELRESAKYLPSHDRFKIYIVDEVHMLSKAAFNAFLKTLEEPPGHVKFLFATTDPQALPETILSRCQRHNFRLVPLKLIAERIQSIAKAEEVTIDEGAVALVARQAAGSMRDALSLLDQVFSSCAKGTPITTRDAAQALGALDRAVVARMAGALLQRDATAVLQGVAEAYDGGHDLKRLAEDLATHLRNLIAARVAGAPLDLPDHEIKSLREQSSSADPAELLRLFDLVHGALYEISRSTQPRNSLEIALLRAVFLAPAVSIQTLLTRADEIVRRLHTGSPPPPPSGGGGGRGPELVRPRPSFGAPPSMASRSAPPSEPRQQGAAPAVAQAQVPPMATPTAPWARRLTLVPSEEPVVAEVAPAPAPEPVVEIAPVIASVPEPMPPTDAALLARWPELVAGVSERKRAAGACLSHARPVSLTNGELELAFRAGDLYVQRIGDERATLETIFSELLGAPTRLRIVEVQQERGAGSSIVGSIAEAHDRVAKTALDARLRNGREHPAIQRAVAILGAEIEDVRDLGSVP